MSFERGFTIDELLLTTDSQSNPLWYVEDESRAVSLHPEQQWIASVLYLAKTFEWKIELGTNQESVWDGLITPVQIPIRKSMCTRCRGKGTMANPAFNGTSIEWWQEHGGADYEDDLHEYMHGDMYDIPCEYNCSGGVAYAADWQRIIDLYRAYGEEEKANEWINAIYYEVLIDWYEGREEELSERAYFDREWAI